MREQNTEAMITMSKASEIVAIALAQIGYKEKASNKNLDDPAANAGSANWTKYARDLASAGYYNGNKNGFAWCDVFVDWCFFKAYGKDEGQRIQCQTGPYGAGCTYCRVSTDNDEQLSSFELQQNHYKHLVQDHPNWELKAIYADEGISGTSLKNRDQFNEMIEACKQGQYDLIVTKSVSRFARNLVDCISLIRMLKGLKPPVGVYFETDNLYTLDENKEFMLSFLATFAQEESVKKSESMNWSLQQRFKDGKLLTPAPLGYDRPKDVTGRYIKYAPLEVNEAEAKIVKFIYDAYLSGWCECSYSI